MVVTQANRHPTTAFHIEHDLLRTLARRNIKGDDGLLAEQALGFQAVALLESLNGDGQLFVIRG